MGFPAHVIVRILNRSILMGWKAHATLKPPGRACATSLYAFFFSGSVSFFPYFSTALPGTTSCQPFSTRRNE